MKVKASAVVGLPIRQTTRLAPAVDRRDAGRSRQRRRRLTDSQLGCIDGFPASPTPSTSSLFQFHTHRARRRDALAPSSDHQLRTTWYRAFNDDCGTAGKELTIVSSIDVEAKYPIIPINAQPVVTIPSRSPTRDVFSWPMAMSCSIGSATPKFLGGPNPSVHLVSPSDSFTFSSLPLSPPLPFPSLALEVGPLSTARDLGNAVRSPPAGSGAEPQRKANLVHFSLKT